MTSDNAFASDIGGPVHLIQGADDAMYLVDINGGRVIRIKYVSGNQPPTIDSLTVTPTSGAGPLDVSFSATASDADGDDLTYRWFFGDGQ